MTTQQGEIVPYQKRVADFRGLLQALKPQLEMALPRHVKADRLARVVLTSVQKVPDLLDCTRESLLGCIMTAAQLGLEPDGTLGHAYLIPFNDRRAGVKICTLIIGYKGLLKLARQSGEISSISAHVVRAGDKFSFRFGLQEKLQHTPQAPPADAEATWKPGPVIAVYAVAVLKDGTRQFDVMYRYEVEAIRARSKSGNNGPWVTDWDEMAKKTVLRRLSKLLPASVELQTAVALDERADAGVSQELSAAVDVSAVESGGDAALPAVEPEPTKLDALAATVKAGKEKKLDVQIVGAAEDPLRG